MARKVLGQAAPAAATDTTLYAVPAGKQAVVSSLSISNRSEISAPVQVRVRVAGAANTDKQLLLYEYPIAGRSAGPWIATVGVTLTATDEVRVRDTNGTCSFQLFGDEADI